MTKKDDKNVFLMELNTLYHQLTEHQKQDKNNKDLSTRTQRLMQAHRKKKAKKVGEEAVEVAIEAIDNNKKNTIDESIDLIYNLLALWIDMDITFDDVGSVIKDRRLKLGISEKLPKEKVKKV